MTDPLNGNRRAFLGAGGLIGLTAASGFAGAQPNAAPANAAPATAAPSPASSPHWLFFTPEEKACVEAIVNTFIPTDALGPGAVEAGVVEFIDRQLFGGPGHNARQCVAGPFATGTPEQGYQLPMTLAELYRMSLAELDEWSRQSNGGLAFAKLTPAQQNAALHQIREGKLTLPTAPARLFLSAIYNHCMEGFFSDPIHGGNRGKAGWKLVGFPGPFRIYSAEIANYRGRRFESAPLGIADLG